MRLCSKPSPTSPGSGGAGAELRRGRFDTRSGCFSQPGKRGLNLGERVIGDGSSLRLDVDRSARCKSIRIGHDRSQ